MADDDLERLLDEVERELCRLPGRTAAAGGPRHGHGEDEEGAAAAAAKVASSAQLLTGADSSLEDLDDILDEICKDSSPAKAPLKLRSSSASLAPGSYSASVQARGKRCCPVYLGGSASPCGLGTNISKRTCDQLRCTACDFRVSLFNDYTWDQSCDYLFFRNNMPELNKLRGKLILKKGSRAYACQCSWRSMDALTELHTQQQLRWFQEKPYENAAAPWFVCQKCHELPLLQKHWRNAAAEAQKWQRVGQRPASSGSSSMS